MDAKSTARESAPVRAISMPRSMQAAPSSTAAATPSAPRARTAHSAANAANAAPKEMHTSVPNGLVEETEKRRQGSTNAKSAAKNRSAA